MVGLKCSPPPRSARPKPADVAARCPKLATLAELMLKEETFEVLPWQYQGQDSTWNKFEFRWDYCIQSDVVLSPMKL